MSKELESSLDARGVLTLTMNRPAVHNAFDEHQIARLHSALTDAASNSEVRLLVLASSGKHFCAGADIDYMKRMGSNSRQENLDDATALAQLMSTLNSLPKPTVARIQGAAYGGAVGLVSCCDIAIGSTSTVLSLSEVKIGLVPATIAPYVVRAVGPRSARRLFITGERVAAHAAQAIGLLHSVVEDEQLDDAVEGVVSAMLENSPHAMSVAKQLVFEVTSDTVSESMIDRTVNIIASLRESADGKEGTAAFLEKRSPVWQKTP